MSSPYQDMGLPAPPRPERWMRLLTALTPERLGARWRWYRWTVGGRWSFRLSTFDRGIPVFRWRRVNQCPGRAHAEFLGGEPVPHGVCVDYSEALLMIDEEVGMMDPPLDGVCHCEVHDG